MVPRRTSPANSRVASDRDPGRLWQGDLSDACSTPWIDATTARRNTYRRTNSPPVGWQFCQVRVHRECVHQGPLPSSFALSQISKKSYSTPRAVASFSRNLLGFAPPGSRSWATRGMAAEPSRLFRCHSFLRSSSDSGCRFSYCRRMAIVLSQYSEDSPPHRQWKSLSLVKL